MRAGMVACVVVTMLGCAGGAGGAKVAPAALTAEQRLRVDRLIAMK